MQNPGQRFRETSTRRPTSTTFVNTDNGVSPVTISNNTYSGADTGDLKVMNDYVTPNFRQLSANGQIVNTAMQSTLDAFDYRSATVNYVEKSPYPGRHTLLVTGEFGGWIDGTQDQESLWLTNNTRMNTADWAAVTKLASIQARNQMSKIDIQSLVAVAEGRKTLDFLADLVKDLAGLVRGIKTGNEKLIQKSIGGRSFNPNKLKKKAPPKPKSDLGFSEAISSRWLEWRYAAIPLAMDIQGLIDAIRHPLPNPEIRYTSRGSASRESISSHTVDRVSSGYGTATWEFTHDSVVSARAYCMYTADLKYAEARNIGLYEFPKAFWELVSFSFLYDWIVNVGEWLEALTPKLGIKVLAEGVTTTQSYNLVRQCVAWYVPPTNSYDASGLVGHVDTRHIVSVLRVPGLWNLYSLPPIDVKINVTRAIDAIALLRQQFR